MLKLLLFISLFFFACGENGLTNEKTSAETIPDTLYLDSLRVSTDIDRDNIASAWILYGRSSAKFPKHTILMSIRSETDTSFTDFMTFTLEALPDTLDSNQVVIVQFPLDTLPYAGRWNLQMLLTRSLDSVQGVIIDPEDLLSALEWEPSGSEVAPEDSSTIIRADITPGIYLGSFVFGAETRSLKLNLKNKSEVSQTTMTVESGECVTYEDLEGSWEQTDSSLIFNWSRKITPTSACLTFVNTTELSDPPQELELRIFSAEATSFRLYLEDVEDGVYLTRQ